MRSASNIDLHFLITLIYLLLLFSVCSAYSDLDVLLKLKSSMIGPNGSGLKGLGVIVFSLSSLHLLWAILPEIGLLNKLVNLTLSNVNLTGTLPLEMANLTSLKVFNISNNVFKGNFPGQIVLGMTELETLDAYDNNFTGPLPVEIASLK
ncbi:hypothetical protein Patl1_09519 [Pistacia atlantica]|uniref:Uncharacterized protein n=1 Tax=Pistacia atlantica TaxID=434234 RepID=A0ACC1AHV4_9ROSI|nr:hypothetical protein Patl1_09519 [Pistacia atlantica]